MSHSSQFANYKTNYSSHVLYTRSKVLLPLATMTRSLVGPIIQRHDSAVVDNEEHYLRTLSKHQRQFSAHHGIVLSTFGFSRMEIVQCTESV